MRGQIIEAERPNISMCTSGNVSICDLSHQVVSNTECRNRQGRFTFYDEHVCLCAVYMCSAALCACICMCVQLCSNQRSARRVDDECLISAEQGARSFVRAGAMVLFDLCDGGKARRRDAA